LVAILRGLLVGLSFLFSCGLRTLGKFSLLSVQQKSH